MDELASLRACLSELLGEPPPAGGEDDLRAWLAQLGLGLVAVAEPQSFDWQGYFLGRSGSTWALWFGVPPGVVFDPAPGASGERPEAVLLLTAHRLHARVAAEAAGAGRVDAIAIAPAAEAAMVGVEQVCARAGQGLDGDRYAAGTGTFSDRRPAAGRNLTLVEAEAIEGTLANPLTARRNIIVRGIHLDGLLGRRFRIGEVECFGQRRCEPCAVLERLTHPGVLRALVHRGGLRADILNDGTIRVGDVVSAL